MNKFDPTVPCPSPAPPWLESFDYRTEVDWLVVRRKLAPVVAGGTDSSNKLAARLKDYRAEILAEHPLAGGSVAYLLSLPVAVARRTDRECAEGVFFPDVVLHFKRGALPLPPEGVLGPPNDEKHLLIVAVGDETSSGMVGLLDILSNEARINLAELTVTPVNPRHVVIAAGTGRGMAIDELKRRHDKGQLLPDYVCRLEVHEQPVKSYARPAWAQEVLAVDFEHSSCGQLWPFVSRLWCRLGPDRWVRALERPPTSGLTVARAIAEICFRSRKPEELSELQHLVTDIARQAGVRADLYHVDTSSGQRRKLVTVE